MDLRQSSPSVARNREPILTELQRVLPPDPHVLELASGSGEHAAFFARAIPSLTWQPSDPDPGARDSIDAWRTSEGLSNILPPLDIELTSLPWPTPRKSYDAIIAINVIHISPWEATLGLIAGAARALASEGVLIAYGAYRRAGRHTAPSNESFDQWLKVRDPRFGVRDIEAVESAAGAEALALREIIEMPANNLMLVFAR